MVRIMTQLSVFTCITLMVAGSSFSGEATDRSDSWFSKLDADNDKRVSQQEFLGTWNAWFNKQDRNEDQHLSVEEWSKSKGTRSGSALRKLFTNVDKDGDEKISSKEYVAFRKRQFQASDEDNDGYWSRSEGDRRAAKGRKKVSFDDDGE